MCEIESILNARPLTTIFNDPRDLDVITPNHLLLLKNTNFLPPELFNPKDICSLRRWKQVNYLANVFWSRCRSGYLIMLQRCQKWRTENRNFAIRGGFTRPITGYGVNPRNNSAVFQYSDDSPRTTPEVQNGERVAEYGPKHMV